MTGSERRRASGRRPNTHTRTSPRAALGAPASGAAGALAAYGFDETPVFPQAPQAPQAPQTLFEPQAPRVLEGAGACAATVSYTHLTLPTIYSV